MGRKVRKQLNIDEAQDLALKREAEKLGVSESEVLRRVLDAWTAGGVDRRRAHAVEGLRAIQARLEERRKELGPGEPYTWRRDDAYEDRLERYDRS